jgi:RNA polymerase sigma-70 factor (ECF subfamily)
MIDPALIAAAQRGEAEAFASLVTHLRSLVVGLCFAEMGDWDAADDCAQEVFVRLHTRLGTLREVAAFPAWLRTVVRHVCASERRRPHHRGESLEDLATEPAAPDGAEPLRNAMDRQALLGRLTDLVAQLPPAQRRVLVLRHFQELDIATIASLTELTPASVRTILCRARVSLRKLVEQQMPELRNLVA